MAKKAAKAAKAAKPKPAAKVGFEVNVAPQVRSTLDELKLTLGIGLAEMGRMAFDLWIRTQLAKLGAKGAKARKLFKAQ